MIEGTLIKKGRIPEELAFPGSVSNSAKRLWGASVLAPSFGGFFANFRSLYPGA
jgi:hypothetical protein